MQDPAVFTLMAAGIFLEVLLGVMLGPVGWAALAALLALMVARPVR